MCKVLEGLWRGTACFSFLGVRLCRAFVLHGLWTWVLEWAIKDTKEPPQTTVKDGYELHVSGRRPCKNDCWVKMLDVKDPEDVI